MSSRRSSFPRGRRRSRTSLAKFAGARYVVDPGTRRERSYFLRNDGEIGTATTAEGLPIVTPLTLGTLPPLPPGEHVVETYWVFSATHCDGLAVGIWPTDPGGGCIAAGETKLRTMAFEVTRGHF